MSSVFQIKIKSAMASPAMLFICRGLLLSALCPQAAWAQKVSDLNQPQQIAIEKALECSKSTMEINRFGCAILKEFNLATAPAPSLFKNVEHGNERRLLGATVVIGHPAEREWMGRFANVRWNVVIFGIRYSDNFHKKIAYPNGVSPPYIWPNIEKQSVLILDVVNTLKRDRFPVASHPLIRFANDVELNFSEVEPSTGLSWVTAETRTYVRQRNEFLYLVEIGGKDEDHPKYWISKISLTQTAQ